jgi:uncharacterized protein involved in exopolysaccharide biosynthesis
MTNETFEMSPVTALRTLQERKWLLLFLILAAILIGGYSTDIRHQVVEQPVVFKSEMTLLISPPPVKRTDDSEQQSELESWFASEELVKQLLVSEEVVTRAAAACGYEGDWRSLRDNIRIKEDLNEKLQRDNSFLLSIEVTASSPTEAQKQAGALGDEVVRYTQDLAAGEQIASKKAVGKVGYRPKSIHRKGSGGFNRLAESQ